jgi:hypothetical protein
LSRLPAQVLIVDCVCSRLLLLCLNLFGDSHRSLWFGLVVIRIRSSGVHDVIIIVISLWLLVVVGYG